MPVCILNLHSVSKKTPPIFVFFQSEIHLELCWFDCSILCIKHCSLHSLEGSCSYCLGHSTGEDGQEFSVLKKPVLPGKRCAFNQHADIFTTVTCTPYLCPFGDRSNILNVFWVAIGTLQGNPSFPSSEFFGRGRQKEDNRTF